MFGKRIEKMDARIEAIGSIDELNAVLGLVRVDAEVVRVVEGFAGGIAPLGEGLHPYHNSPENWVILYPLKQVFVVRTSRREESKMS